MPLPQQHRLWRWMILAGLFLVCLGVVEARAGNTLAVFYPKVSEPYLTVFQTIIDGIQATPGYSVIAYELTDDFDPVQLAKELRASSPGALIALGKTGYLAAKAVNPGIPVVFGALRMAPDGLSGISLTADPGQMFRYLKLLVPNAKQVYVVYDPAANGWLIRLAETAAHAEGLQLVAYPVSDLRDAVLRYRSLLQEIDPVTSTIWLPFDNVTANDEVVLPMLLEASWARNVVLFSSKPAHAQRGVLFSMFPDNFAMGKRLATMLASSQPALDKPGVVPLSDLQLAVNLRTAAHLGLRFTPLQQAAFNLTFPSQR